MKRIITFIKSDNFVNGILPLSLPALAIAAYVAVMIYHIFYRL